ncbi:MAG: hypothetical protein JW798_09915 [Prolixibacteraceae bacterium]|nr:hypothetical protein [Prolixibacteraceae bacterium]
MKAILLITVLFFFVSCGSGKKKNQDNNNEDAKTESNAKPGNSCEAFLDDYEKWVDEVVKIYKKVQENPMDVQNTQDLMTATQKMSEYSEKWQALYDCSNDEKYAKRMEKLQKRVDDAMDY